MAKTILGVDVGYDNLKLALVRGRTVLRTASVPMPRNLLQDGRIVSPESMAEQLRMGMKENGIRAGLAAFVIPRENVFVKNVVMPAMTEEQLLYNLPFEFRDYITGEIRDYVFDYALVGERPAEAPGEADDDGSGEDSGVPGMELLAVGASRAYMDEIRDVIRRAGMKLSMAAPPVCAFIQLIRLQQKMGADETEYCILDLGYESIRMHIFKGDRYEVTRVMDMGLSLLDEVIAERFNVDIHLAHTYLMTNYEDCQRSEECETAYGNIAMELMRVLNFYRYSNQDSSIGDVWLCGGGAVIRPLREAIREGLDLEVHPASELVPGGDKIQDCNSFVQAIGIAME